MNADPWHGTPGGYTNHRCRCEDCQRAWREYRPKRERRILTPVEMPPSFPARACNLDNQWLFFPDRSDQTAYAARVRLAKDICASCYHRPECAAWAIARPAERGIWGGLTERERKRIRLANTA